MFGTLRELHDAFLAQALPQLPTTPSLWLGLAASMTPSAFGLSVAVVLLLGREYLVGQSEFITEQIQEFSARLINALIDRPDVRLGHR
jgi:biopolymer transport protein ExbB/TolQ